MKKIPDGWKRLAAALLLSMLVLAVYARVGEFSFLNYDDGIYVSGNVRVHGGLTRDGVAWAFKAFLGATWQPMVWLSFMTDASLFGADPGWYHRVNGLLHLANAILLFLVLDRMTGAVGRSAFVAALFAAHPLNVQAVAWISSRKDVLSTLFLLLSMGAYGHYVRRPGAGRYLAVALFFALGLMAKPMLVTLPFVFLLLDYWPLGRFSPPEGSDGPAAPFSPARLGRLIGEKIPLIALSSAAAVVTWLAESEAGAIKSLVRFPLGLRLSNALVSYATYLAKAVWPSSLSVFYPHPATVGDGIPAWRVVTAGLLLAGVSALVLRQAKRRPYLAVGWLWYLGTLIPVIGLVQFGEHAMADRFAYVPMIGIFVALAWGVPEALGRLRAGRLAPAVLGAAALLALSVAARVQTGYWRNNVTLFAHAAEVTEKNWVAWNNLSAAYVQNGDYRRAVDCGREAVRIKPDYVEAWYNLGLAYEMLGDPSRAAASYREAVRVVPHDAEAWFRLGNAQVRLGDARQAAASFRQTVRYRSDDARAWNNLGNARLNLGELDEAVSSYREAIRVKRDYAPAWTNLANAYNIMGEPRQAMASAREALRLQPDFPEALYTLALACSRSGQRQEAREIQRRLREIDPAKAAALAKAAGLKD